MIRLTLGPQGDGKLGFSFMNEEPCVFRRISWVFDRGKVELNLDKSSGGCQRDREFTQLLQKVGGRMIKPPF